MKGVTIKQPNSKHFYQTFSVKRICSLSSIAPKFHSAEINNQIVGCFVESCVEAETECCDGITLQEFCWKFPKLIFVDSQCQIDWDKKRNGRIIDSESLRMEANPVSWMRYVPKLLISQECPSKFRRSFCLPEN